jgi:predicted nuclease of predicted toxin-antitoxin system
MRFLTDANIFVPMVNGLRRLVHDVFDSKEENLEKLTDNDVFKLAQDQKRILISMDKDFSNIITYPPGEHCGIIVVKLYSLKVDEATDIFLDSLTKLKTGDIRQNLVIIDRNKTRIRKERLYP